MIWQDVNWGVTACILLLIALIIWQIARHGFIPQHKSRPRELSPEYFKGLNFVLNEQPDKAIEIFTRMLDVDSDMIDMHFAVANLFRRRGEVDRAIRIHQNLMVRPKLARDQYALALLELGSDYMHAGLLDRAENIFQELIATGQHRVQANQCLLDIYQQEKEWRRAIAVARELEHISHCSNGEMIAHFYCELACLEINRGQPGNARDYVLQALASDADCVRASILDARIATHQGKYRQAIKTYHKVETQDPECLSEIIQELLECYQKEHRSDDCLRYLNGLVTRHDNTDALLTWMDLIVQKQGATEAVRQITKMLEKHPTVHGVDRLMDLLLAETSGELHDNLQAVKKLTTSLLAREHLHRCNACGFDTRSRHWQCPRCKNWNTIKLSVNGIPAAFTVAQAGASDGRERIQ